MALPNKTKIPVGTILAGKYRITREIGRGGMAAVYEAENVDIGKRIAIKVLAQELTASTVVVERFFREARAAAAIRSPYICDVYDSGRLDDGRPFLVLELLEGESLYERMTKVRWFDIEATLAVITQACRGLTKAHAAQIVHRDLKPENIFLTKDEEGQLLAKLLDFGLAKFYAPLGGTKQQQRLTREGAVFGTPAYMSPEQVRGQGAVDHRADLWALGCIVYECFTGRTVWQTEQGVAMTFAQIAAGKLPDPREYRPDLPPSFGAWFQKALHRDINQRFQTAKEFGDELSIALSGSRASAAALPSPAAVNPFLDAALPAPQQAPSIPQQQPHPSFQGPPQPQHPSFQGSAPVIGAAPPSGMGPHASVPMAPAKPKARGPNVAAIIAIGLSALAAIGIVGYVGFTKLGGTDGAASASASASAPPPASASVSAPKGREAPPAPAALPWIPFWEQAQESIAKGDLKTASKHLKEAFDRGGHGMPRTLLEYVQSSLGSAGAPCKLTGLARPRTYDLVPVTTKRVHAGRPSIAIGPKGPVIVWTDAHDGAEHVYAVKLDNSLRSEGPPIDITPEAARVTRIAMTSLGAHMLLSYADLRGADASILVRRIDPDAHIDASPVTVGSAKGAAPAPIAMRAPDGSTFVVWSGASDQGSEDLFLRKLNPSLEPAGAEVRMTDFTPAGASKPRARAPSLAFENNALLVAYRLERDPAREAHVLRVALADAARGIDAKKPSRNDRTVGVDALLNPDKSKADLPSIACGAGACYAVWHGDSGAVAAYVDPNKGQAIWRRTWARAGVRPSVAISPTGQAQVAWYQARGIHTASFNRDGVGTPTRVLKVSYDNQPVEIISAERAGEHYMTWLDYEAGILEVFAARVTCR